MPKQNRQDDKKKKKVTVFPRGPKDAKESQNRSRAAKARRRVKGKFADEPDRPEIERADPADPQALAEAREKLKSQRLLEKAEKGGREGERRRRLASFTAAEKEKAEQEFLASAKAEGEVADALRSLGYEPKAVANAEGKLVLGYSDKGEEQFIDLEGYTSDITRKKFLLDAASRINRTKKSLEDVDEELIPEADKRISRAEKRVRAVESGQAVPATHGQILNILDKQIDTAKKSYDFALQDPETTKGDLYMLKQDIEIAERERAETEKELRMQAPEMYDKLDKEARLELGAAKTQKQRLKEQRIELEERRKKEIDRVLADIKETSVYLPDIVIKDPAILDEAGQRKLREAAAASREEARAMREERFDEGRIEGAPQFQSVQDIYDEKRYKEHVFRDPERNFEKNSYRHPKDPAKPTPKDKGRKGIKGTISFQREQAKRRTRGIREGTDVKSYKLWNDYGVSPKKVPQQKADISFGPNVQYVTATDQFDFIDPRDKADSTVLEFALARPPRHLMNVDFLMDQPVRTMGTDKHGAPIRDQQGILKTRPTTFYDLGIEETDAPTLEAVAKKVGLRGYFAEQAPGDETGHVFRFVTEQGQPVNEDQMLHLQQLLKDEYGLYQIPGDPAITKVRGADLQRRVINTPFGASKSQAEDARSLETWTENITDKQAEVKLARRNREGKLEEGDADVLYVKRPGFFEYGEEGNRKRLLEPGLVSLRMQERSDAIGFGRSYRPGEEELNKLVTAIPREKRRRQMEAAIRKADETGDTSDIETILREDDKYANGEKIGYIRDNLLVAGDAAAAASVYTGTRTVQRKVASKALEDTPVGRWIDSRLALTDHDWFRDAKNSLGRESFDWYTEKKWMIKHPASDPELQVGGVEWNPHRYRDTLIDKRPGGTRDARKLERTTRQVSARVKGRQSALDVLDEAPSNNPLKRIDRKYRARQSHLLSGEAYDPQTLLDRVEKEIETNRMQQRGMAGGKMGEFARPGSKAEAQAVKNLEELNRLKDQLTPEVNERVWSNRLGVPDPGAERLDKLDAIYKDTHIFKPGTLKKTGKIGLYGAAGVAAVGAGVFAYDKYKEHQMEEKGQDYVSIGSRVAKPLPKNVYKPTVQVKKQYTKPLPHTYLTDAVDLEGKKVLKGVKVKGSMKKVPLRPTDRKDVGGDTYSQGPLIGTPSIKLIPSRGEPDVLFTKDLKAAKNTRTITRGPAYIQIGKKRRFEDTRGTRLRSANPNKLTSSERDLAAMDYLSGQNRARIQNLHMGDTKFHELVTDPDSVSSLRRRTANSYTPNISKRAQEAKTAKEKLSQEVDRARLDELFHGRTVEDADQMRRMQSMLDKEYKERNKEW